MLPELQRAGKRVAAKVRGLTRKIAKDDRNVDQAPTAEEIEAIVDAVPGLSPVARKALIEQLGSIAIQGASDAADVLNLSAADYEAMLSVAHERAAEWAEEYVGEFITGINDTTRQGVRDAVAGNIRDGGTMDELADDLMESHWFSEPRADAIARTETCRAQIQGTQQLYGEAGIEQKEWLMADTEPCPICEELNGQRVALDGEFTSEDLPEGIDGPPAHPNCRCDILPVLPEPAEE